MLTSPDLDSDGERRPDLRAVRPPFFELGPKNLLRLPEIIEVGSAAQVAGATHGVSVILTVPTALIAPVQSALPGIFVFAQTMDEDEPGGSVGRDIAESLVDAGARGVMLGHDSNPLDATTLERTVGRAQRNGLMTMVCAGADDDALRVARLAPTIILYEPPQLIGRAGGGHRPWIKGIDDLVGSLAPGVMMMHAGGVGTPGDAREIMRLGAAGTGSTSGVLRSTSPSIAVAEFIRAVRQGYDDHLDEGAAAH